MWDEMKVTKTTEPVSLSLAEKDLSTSWQMDSRTLKKAGHLSTPYVLLDTEQGDINRVVSSYQKAPVPGYGIKSIQVIYNPNLNRLFAGCLEALNHRHDQTAFRPRWREEKGASSEWRNTTHRILEAMAAPHTDPHYPHVQLVPMWHGTNAAIFDSLFKTGFANLATVDSGFFGKGIYSAGEARYSWQTYSLTYPQPALLMNWVATYSAYPVIHGDKSLLEGKGNYANYDAHFIPIAENYLPCAVGQAHTYTELVVFAPNQCLSRYVVELQSDTLACLQEKMPEQATQPSEPLQPIPQPQTKADVAECQQAFEKRLRRLVDKQHDVFWKKHSPSFFGGMPAVISKLRAALQVTTASPWPALYDAVKGYLVLDTQSSSGAHAANVYLPTSNFLDDSYSPESPCFQLCSLIARVHRNKAFLQASHQLIALEKSLRQADAYQQQLGEIKKEKTSQRQAPQDKARLLTDEALAHIRAAHFKEALRCLNDSLALDPAPFTYRLRADVYLQAGRISEALVDYENALRGNPDNPQYCFDYAEALLLLERRDEAVTALTRARTLSLPPQPAKYVQRAADRVHTIDRLLAQIAGLPLPQDPAPSLPAPSQVLGQEQATPVSSAMLAPATTLVLASTQPSAVADTLSSVSLHLG